MLPVSDFEGERKHLVMCTKRGWIKKTRLSAFASLEGKKRGLTAISLEESDELKWASICDSSFDSDASVILGTSQGFATHFSLGDTDLRATGRTSRGVRALILRVSDHSHCSLRYFLLPRPTKKHTAFSLSFLHCMPPGCGVQAVASVRLPFFVGTTTRCLTGKGPFCVSFRTNRIHERTGVRRCTTALRAT